MQDTRTILGYELEYLKSIQAASSDQIGKDIVTHQPNVGELVIVPL